MSMITKEDLIAAIDFGKLRRFVSARADYFSRNKSNEEVITTSNTGHVIKVTITVLFVIALVCAAAYGIYKFFHRDYDEFDEFDDAFDDDYDFYDDDFEDEEAVS